MLNLFNYRQEGLLRKLTPPTYNFRVVVKASKGAIAPTKTDQMRGESKPKKKKKS